MVMDSWHISSWTGSTDILNPIAERADHCLTTFLTATSRQGPCIQSSRRRFMDS